MPVLDKRPTAPRKRADRAAGPTRGWLPGGLRVYAIGDIHGRLDLLVELLKRIRVDAATLPEGGRYRLVMLGDYIDRGSDSKEVIELLVSGPLPRVETTFLRGNHEQTMLQFLEDLQAGPGWLTYGGVNTLLSYGVRPPVDVPRQRRLAFVQQRLRDALPPGHLSFLRALAPYETIGTYLFVHAGIRPGVALEDQRLDDLVWIREEFLTSPVDHGRIVVHGHTIAMKAESLPNRICIDTGAYATGRLTAAVLEGTTRRFIDTAS
ncbi:MAG: metallophosphoesterase family protein [Rhodospirillaceae bacterium]